MHKILLLGRLVKKPIFKTYEKDGETRRMCSFIFAVNDQHTERVEFYYCVAFGKKVEYIEKYVKKGYRYLLEGSGRHDSYEKEVNDSKLKINVFKVLVANIEFADGNKDAGISDEPEFMYDEEEIAKMEEGYYEVPLE